MDIYLNNYRGFKNSFIEINHVNFLVGENSSGKSSFLYVLAMINSLERNKASQFNREEFNLGPFHEILSHSAKEKAFQIGKIIATENGVLGIILHFVSNQDVPVINRVSYFTDEHQVEAFIRDQEHIDFVKTRKKLTAATYKKYVADVCLNELSGNLQTFEYRNTYFPIYSILANTLGRRRDLYDNMERLLNRYFKSKWIAPIRAKPNRYYEIFSSTYSPDGTHTPLVLKRLLSKKSSNSYTVFLKTFGKNSGLFSDIEIKNLGKNDSSPFQINIRKNRKNVKISNVGYGVSQSLPVVTEIITAPEKSWLFIQQPEVHLHPKAQASLGSLIHEEANKNKKRFAIETHSDYLIDHYRISINKTKKNVSSQILFFENIQDTFVVHNIKIDNNGKLIQPIPKSYRDFYIKEQLDLLDI